MKLIKKFLFSPEFLFRFVAVILVIGGLTLKQYEFCCLLLSGVTLGIYYGLYNDIIWRPKGKLETSLPYRAHQLWIHIICGVVGSVALYLLLGAIDINNKSASLEKLGVKEFILFGIAILAYVGLLPRILWFLTYAQQNMFSRGR